LLETHSWETRHNHKTLSITNSRRNRQRIRIGRIHRTWAQNLPSKTKVGSRDTTAGQLQVSQHVDTTLGVPGGYRANLIAEAMKLDIDARIAHG
jgi:hypothetical protein